MNGPKENIGTEEISDDIPIVKKRRIAKCEKWGGQFKGSGF